MFFRCKFLVLLVTAALLGCEESGEGLLIQATPINEQSAGNAAEQAVPAEGETTAAEQQQAEIAGGALQQVQADDKEAESVGKEIGVEPITWKALEEWAGKQKGKVVVIDLWSTWCTSCVHEFPHFVALHDQLGEQAVFASLSLDFYGGEPEVPADVLQSVKEFLQAKKATTKNFIAIDGDEAVLKQVQAASIPIAIVYGKDGKLHKLFKNDDNEYGPKGFTYEKDIAPVVKSLIASP